MGIPNYFYHVLKNHSKIIKELEYTEIHNFYLDSNSIIYDTIYGMKDGIPSNEAIYEEVYQKIIELIDNVKPQHKTFVAFDGVAPLAKIDQQRHRRYKSTLVKNVLESKSTISFNTNQITPGTKFMEELDEYLLKKFKVTRKIIYSGPQEEGEGEHKLFNYIREYKQKSHNHLVYGLDADLIMLGLLSVKYNNNIYLYRETHHFDYISNINKDTDYVFDIRSLAHRLDSILENNNITRSINDYIMLCFLCGNDFLPHFTSVNIRNEGIHYLIDVYRDIKKVKDVGFVLENNEINWGVINNFLNALAANEEAMTMDNIKWKRKKAKHIRIENKEELLNAIPLFDMKKERLIEDKWNNYYTFLFNGNENIKDVCLNYFEMFEWTWWYYHGTCKNSFVFYRYSHAPLFKSLILYTPLFPGKEMCKYDTSDQKINSYTQLIFALPKSDHSSFIPSEILEKCYIKFPELMDNDFEVDYSFCKYFWECKVEFNYIPFRQLNEYVMSITTV